MIGKQTGPEFTAQREGFRDKVYKDTVGKPTVGFGFNLEAPGTRQELTKAGINVRDLLSGKKTLTKEEALPVFDKLYNKASEEAKNAFDRLKLGKGFDNLREDYKDILSDLSYNMGAGGVAQFRKTMELMAADKPKELAANLEKSKWYRQVGDRSKAIVAHLRTLA